MRVLPKESVDPLTTGVLNTRTRPGILAKKSTISTGISAIRMGAFFAGFLLVVAAILLVFFAFIVMAAMGFMSPGELDVRQ